MSDIESSPARGEVKAEGTMEIAAADQEFIMECLRHPSGGFIAIDAKAVAEAKGYSNHRSVQNRIAQMKKKYNLPFGSVAATSKGEKTEKNDAPVKTPAKTPTKKASAAAGPNEPAIPGTPSKNKVTKAKTPRKKAEPKAKKGKKAATPEFKDEEMEVVEEASTDEDQVPKSLKVEEEQSIEVEA